jgi:DNA-binding transcriptional LysR family regulator
VVVDVRFQSDAAASNVAQLAAGEVDLAIAARLPLHSGVVQQRLFADRDVVVLRARHPAARLLTAERFAALPHVQVSPRGLERDFVDEALARKGLTRKVVARVPHFVAAAMLVSHSDAVAVVPQRVAQAWAQTAPVRFVESPVPLPHFTMSQFFPEVLRKAPEHVWLRQLVKEVAEA